MIYIKRLAVVSFTSTFDLLAGERESGRGRNFSCVLTQDKLMNAASDRANGVHFTPSIYPCHHFSPLLKRKTGEGSAGTTIEINPKQI